MHLARRKGIIMGSGQVGQQPRMDMALCPSVGRLLMRQVKRTRTRSHLPSTMSETRREERKRKRLYGGGGKMELGFIGLSGPARESAFGAS